MRLTMKEKKAVTNNGSEFINTHFIEYSKAERITFTRGRAYKKNDGCYVEQKNYSVVRCAVGYARYDTEEEIDLLNRLYRHLRLYTNYFQPSMKLIKKTRTGPRVQKWYDPSSICICPRCASNHTRLSQ